MLVYELQMIFLLQREGKIMESTERKAQTYLKPGILEPKEKVSHFEWQSLPCIHLVLIPAIEIVNMNLLISQSHPQKH